MIHIGPAHSYEEPFLMETQLLDMTFGNLLSDCIRTELVIHA